MEDKIPKDGTLRKEGYSKTSKFYRIYIPGYGQIKINMDSTFDEEIAFNMLEFVQL